MWSLPDIVRMNEAATIKALKQKDMTEHQLCEGETCEICDKPAISAIPLYDVFGDDPKGHIFLCEDHDDHDVTRENYFWCDRCERYMISNYTWECYFVNNPETNECLCLNCALDEALEDQDNWITDVKQVTRERVRKSKHLIPVQGEHWKKSLIFRGNVEFDAMSGEEVTGLSSTGPRENAIKKLQDIVSRALMERLVGDLPIENKKVPPRCILVLDAAYQFSISIGVYIERWTKDKENANS